MNADLQTEVAKYKSVHSYELRKEKPGTLVDVFSDVYTFAHQQHPDGTTLVVTCIQANEVNRQPYVTGYVHNVHEIQFLETLALLEEHKKRWSSQSEHVQIRGEYDGERIAMHEIVFHCVHPIRFKDK